MHGDISVRAFVCCRLLLHLIGPFDLHTITIMYANEAVSVYHRMKYVLSRKAARQASKLRR